MEGDRAVGVDEEGCHGIAFDGGVGVGGAVEGGVDCVFVDLDGGCCCFCVGGVFGFWVIVGLGGLYLFECGTCLAMIPDLVFISNPKDAEFTTLTNSEQHPRTKGSMCWCTACWEFNALAVTHHPISRINTMDVKNIQSHIRNDEELPAWLGDDLVHLAGAVVVDGLEGLLVLVEGEGEGC